MKLKFLIVAAFFALSGATTSPVLADDDLPCQRPTCGPVTQDPPEIVSCTANSCLYRQCTHYIGQTDCNVWWGPRPPINGPGYPEEP